MNFTMNNKWKTNLQVSSVLDRVDGRMSVVSLVAITWIGAMLEDALCKFCQHTVQRNTDEQMYKGWAFKLRCIFCTWKLGNGKMEENLSWQHLKNMSYNYCVNVCVSLCVCMHAYVSCASVHACTCVWANRHVSTYAYVSLCKRVPMQAYKKVFKSRVMLCVPKK